MFASLSLIVAVRAQIDCYPDATCGSFGVEFSSALECCLQDDLSVQRSYAPVGNADSCQPCIGTLQCIAITGVLWLIFPRRSSVHVS